MIALFDKSKMVRTLDGSLDEMIVQTAAVVEGRAYSESIEHAVRMVVESGAPMCDLPERSESGRCWTRWTVRRVA